MANKRRKVRMVRTESSYGSDAGHEKLIKALGIDMSNKILGRRELQLTLNLECPKCYHTFAVVSGPEFEALARAALHEGKPSREALERAVLGALKSAINDHGPITAEKLTSATKRVLGNLANAGVGIEPPAKSVKTAPGKAF